jgi:histidinol-phosphate aminotransferase
VSDSPKARADIEAMTGYVPGEQPKDPGRVIKLNTNENPYAASATALAATGTHGLQRYPDPIANDVRDAAAALFGADRNWVIAGNGSDDILTIVIRTFVDQGGSAAWFNPSYSLYPVLLDIQGARSIAIELDEGFTIPDDAAAQAAGASLLLITRPNAPTGTAWPLETMRHLAENFDGPVLIDEAYVDFAEDSCAALVGEYGNVIVCRTLSKGYSLAGIRLGFAYANPAIIAQMMKVKDSYNINSLTQRVGAAALRDQATLKTNVERIRRTRAETVAALSELGFDVIPSQTNFLFARPPVDAAKLADKLKQQNIFIRYFSQRRCRQHVRITIGTDAEMAALLDALRELL